MLEDLDASGDNPDFPSEWLDTIVYQLAVRIAPAFGKDAKKMGIIQEASQALEDLLNYNQESGSLFFSPDKTS